MDGEQHHHRGLYGHKQQQRGGHVGVGVKLSPPHTTQAIEAIERRIQLRTPELQRRGLDTIVDNNNYSAHNNNNMLTISNTEHCPIPFERTNKENQISGALVLHSPLLSSICNSNIKQFEAEVLKRQSEYIHRISDLEGRLALFHSRLAMESAERGREQAVTIEEYIDGPIEQSLRRSLDRITTDFVIPILDPRFAAQAADDNGTSADTTPLETTDTTPPPDDNNSNSNNITVPNLVSIERRINHLEDRMNHYKHITLVQAERESYYYIDKTCRRTLPPTLALEMTKANKREGGIIRRFESSAGEHMRLTAEMIASRVSSLGCIQKDVDAWETIDSTFAESYLEEIRRLKQRVMEMRDERIRQDDLVVDRIMYVKKALEEDIFSVCS